MGLFSKRTPCAICGDKVTGLFPWKIEGEYVCNDCHGVVDVPDDMDSSFTMDGFMQYRAFREENQRLKDVFNVTDTVDMGLFGTKIVFDRQNNLFCFDKHLNKTIFSGDQLVSFVVMEDAFVLYEGSAQGLVHHESSVPDRVMAMAPRIEQIRTQQQMRETLARLADKDDQDRQNRTYNRIVDVPEPFKSFNIELRFQHPYWSVMRFSMGGPTFDLNTPDVYEYLHEYRENIEEIEQMVRAFMETAFANAAAGAPSAGAKAPSGTAQAPAAPAQADPAAEIRKYMALMEDGVITPAEFEAKKKQLLGL